MTTAGNMKGSSYFWVGNEEPYSRNNYHSPLLLSNDKSGSPRLSLSFLHLSFTPLLAKKSQMQRHSPQVIATHFGVPMSDTAYASCDLLQSQARPNVLVNKSTHCVSPLICTGVHNLLQSEQCRLEGVSRSHLVQHHT